MLIINLLYMAIQVLQQPSAISFASDPIIAKVKTTLTGKTFLRVKMTCNVKAFQSGEEISYSEEYSYNVADDGAATFNVSNTVATAISRCMTVDVEGTTGTQVAYAAKFTLTYKEAFLEDGVGIEQGELTSSEYKALPGSLTEFERLTASNQDTSTILGNGRILSRKPSGEMVPKGIDLYMPAVDTVSDTISYTVAQGTASNEYSQYTGGVLVPESIRIITSSLSPGELTVSTSRESGKKKYVVPSTPDMRHFLFLNGFGMLESVTAVTKESLSYDTQSEQYVVPKEIGFRSHTQVVGYAGQPFVSLEMSSGFVNREWAEWWVNEFCVTRRAWMMVDGRFLPVAVIPQETTDLYDRSKPGLLSVNFTVRYSFSGGTYNSFVQ